MATNESCEKTIIAVYKYSMTVLLTLCETELNDWLLKYFDMHILNRRWSAQVSAAWFSASIIPMRLGVVLVGGLHSIAKPKFSLNLSHFLDEIPLE